MQYENNMLSINEAERLVHFCLCVKARPLACGRSVSYEHVWAQQHWCAAVLGSAENEFRRARSRRVRAALYQTLALSARVRPRWRAKRQAEPEQRMRGVPRRRPRGWLARLRASGGAPRLAPSSV